MADDGCRAARALAPGRRCEEPGQHGGCGRGCGRCGDCMNAKATPPPEAPEPQESYIVSEGKKRGSTRDVRAEAAFDRYYTVLRVHVRDAHAGGLGRDDRERPPCLLHGRRARVGHGSGALGRQEGAASWHRSQQEVGSSVVSQLGFALKGHGFSRAVTAAKSIAALAAGGMCLSI